MIYDFSQFQEILEKGPQRSLQSWINTVNSKGANLLKSNSKELVPDGLCYSDDVFIHKYIPLL